MSKIKLFLIQKREGLIILKFFHFKQIVQLIIKTQCKKVITVHMFRPYLIEVIYQIIQVNLTFHYITGIFIQTIQTCIKVINNRKPVVAQV